MGRFTRLLTAVLVTATAFTTAAVITPAAHAESVRDGQITRSEVIARAQYWVDHQPGPYSQTQKSPGPGDGWLYRRDCSGYVSMTWHLTDSLGSATLPNVSHNISRNDLKAGDMMVYPGTHVFLFHRWLDGNGNFEYYTFGATPVRHLRANINNASLDNHPNSAYRAMRYNRIVDDAPQPPKRKHTDMDFSGDGSADLVSTTTGGELRYFPNNAGSNAEGRPFEGYKVTGTGWETADRVLEADISGDGAADLLSTTPDGELRYFPNNASGNA
ncbi:FG-GAP-like repeat-containing protein, partial [Lentzea flava]